MFCFNEFAFIVQVKHKKRNSIGLQILSFVFMRCILRLAISTSHMRTLKECSLFLFQFLAQFVVFYGDIISAENWNRIEGALRPGARTEQRDKVILRLNAADGRCFVSAEDGRQSRLPATVPRRSSRQTSPSKLLDPPAALDLPAGRQGPCSWLADNCAVNSVMA